MIIIINLKQGFCEPFSTKAGAAKMLKVSTRTILRATQTGKPFKKDFFAYERALKKIKRGRKLAGFK